MTQAPTVRQALAELVACHDGPPTSQNWSDRWNAAWSAAREALTHPEPDRAALVERLRESKILHILRNPWSWSHEAIREAQLKACNLLEAAAALESIATREWIPVGSAPKTGPAKTILLYVPRLHGTGGPVLAHWAFGGGDDHPPIAPAWYFWTGYNFAELREKPTHWMPLPEPPHE